MKQQEAFLAHIIANPDDDTPRLVYADWLDEHGQPERAEFIRLQIELAPLPRSAPKREILEARVTELLSLHQTSWDEEVRGIGSRRRYHRGFVEGVFFENSRNLVSGTRQLFALTPLRCLSVTNVTAKAIEGFSALRDLSRLRALRVHGGRWYVIGPESWDTRKLRDFLSCAAFARLTTLDLAGNHCGPDGAEAVADMHHLTGLTTLNLRGNLIGSDGMLALAHAEHLSSLTALLLGAGGHDDSANEIGAMGIGSLVSSPELTRLQRLDLDGNDLDASSVAMLVKSHRVAGLTELVLSFNKIGPAGARAIAKSPHLANLKLLNFYNCGLKDSGVSALIASRYLSSSLWLVLDPSDCDQDTWDRALARFPDLHDDPASTVDEEGHGHEPL